MSSDAVAMIYGANGYTGRLIVDEAVRLGLKPILAGRNRATIEALAAECGCPSRVFALDDPKAIVQSLEGVRAVLNCAGPFSATAVPMAEACLQARTHYLDITGEIDVIEAMAALDARAQEAGVTLLPAVGFDVVPSDCLAAMLADRLPSAKQLLLAFTATSVPSPGTAKTVVEMLPRGGLARINGEIRRVPTAWKTRQIPFRSGTQLAETIPWGDIASAWHSTGIPNIETYMAASPSVIRQQRRLRWLVPLLRFGCVRKMARRYIERTVRGPSAKQRSQGGSSFWGRAADDEGRAVEATLETLEGYALTALTAVACLQHVLGGAVKPGFATPSKAFGKDFILQFPDVDFHWQETTTPDQS